MRYFILALSALFIITACSDSTSTDNKYPIQTGTFSIDGPDLAHWDGQSANKQRFKTANAVGDSSFITRPDSLSMQVIAYGENSFAIVIDDSSLSQQFFIDNDMDVTAREITENPDNGIVFKGGGTGGSYELVNVEFNGTYDCDSTYSGGNTQLAYSLHYANGGDHYRTWVLDIGGFRPVLNHIVCGAAIE